MMGMTDPAASDEFEFDVAVSFAGEDREYVEEIVELLKRKGLRVFYDSDYMAETWGEDLVEFFDRVYRLSSRYAILFISHHYATKMWARHERRSALDRALQERAAYVLPVRLDDSPLDGLRTTVGFIDARKVGIDGIVRATLTKVQGTAPAVSSITRVPRTETERQQLLLDRPGCWEYLYFAAEAQARAFGLPGEPGDPDRIHHLALRWTSIYEGLMDWAADVRGTTCPQEYATLLALLADFVDVSVDNYRSFVSDFVSRADDLPRALAAEEHVVISLELTLTIPDEVVQKFQDEIAERLKAQ
jgi:TIR domain